MKLYALLIGIDKYPRSPLNQCVNDSHKMASYLTSLESNPKYSEIIIKQLHDEKANKKAVIGAINGFLAQATDEDTVLFYYSGHGAYEKSAARFPDEQDGKLECIVCYPKPNQSSGFLLADKELRYLFGQFKHNPHMITVFDCCHSGDITRDLKKEKGQVRRIATPFPARDYKEFIFNKKISVSDFKNKSTAELLPFKNHIHIAACTSAQSSWEGSDGGIFTNYLLQLLQATSGQITYQGITRWAKISLQKMTRHKQTPVITVQGEGALSTHMNWLQLHDNTNLKEGILAYNEKDGWYFSRGEVLGVKTGALIDIEVSRAQTIQGKVKSTNLENALVELPEGADLDKSKAYNAHFNLMYSELKVYVNNLDQDGAVERQLKDWIAAMPMVNISEAVAADFFVNIFNQSIYFSFPDDAFRPLAMQMDLLNEKLNIEKEFDYQLKCLNKWHHFDVLENPSNSFDIPPLKVEIQLDGSNEWIDVSNRKYCMSPRPERYEKLLCQYYQVKVTNISRQKLYVGVLTLGSNMGISAKPFDNQAIPLDSGEFKLFYDHRQQSYCSVFFDTYKEIYNWRHEWFHYKFIINNYEDFTTAIPDFCHDAPDEPLILGHRKDMKQKGEGPATRPIRKSWGTMKTTIQLENPEYNEISGDLASHWTDYESSELLMPFLSYLYFNHDLYGYIPVITSKENSKGEKTTAKALTVGKKVGNWIENMIRKRIFKKARRKMPNKPVLLAEGDSWFLFPFLVKDIIDYLIEEFPVRSLAAAGDELQAYKQTNQLLKEVPIVRPRYVLISGGGNDVIGPDMIKLLTNGAIPGSPVEDYMNLPKYNKSRKNLMDLYEYFFQELAKHDSVEQVFVYGYDYIRTDLDLTTIRTSWVNQPMIDAGVREANDRKRIVAYLVDNFNEDLKALAARYPIATYLDTRNLVLQNSSEWNDEIHPNDVGFKKIAKLFSDAINGRNIA